MSKKVTKTPKNNRNIGITCTVIDLHAKISKIAAKAAGEIGVETEIC